MSDFILLLFFFFLLRPTQNSSSIRPNNCFSLEFKASEFPSENLIYKFLWFSEACMCAFNFRSRTINLVKSCAMSRSLICVEFRELL